MYEFSDVEIMHLRQRDLSLSIIFHYLSFCKKYVTFIDKFVINYCIWYEENAINKVIIIVTFFFQLLFLKTCNTLVTSYQ